MTPERLAEIRARVTHAPVWEPAIEEEVGEEYYGDWWVICNDPDGDRIALVGQHGDREKAVAEVIANARQDLFELLVEVERLQTEADNLRDRIRMLEGFALDHGHEKYARVVEAARALVAVTRGGILELNYLWTDLRDALDEVPEEDPR